MDCGDKGAENANVILARADSPGFHPRSIRPPDRSSLSWLTRNVTRTLAKQIVNLCLA